MNACVDLLPTYYADCVILYVHSSDPYERKEVYHDKILMLVGEERAKSSLGEDLEESQRFVDWRRLTCQTPINFYTTCVQRSIVEPIRVEALFRSHQLALIVSIGARMRAVARYDYKARNGTELSIVKGRALLETHVCIGLLNVCSLHRFMEG